jgi:hypothetical protein
MMHRNIVWVVILLAPFIWNPLAVDVPGRFYLKMLLDGISFFAEHAVLGIVCLGLMVLGGLVSWGVIQWLRLPLNRLERLSLSISAAPVILSLGCVAVLGLGWIGGVIAGLVGIGGIYLYYSFSQSPPDSQDGSLQRNTKEPLLSGILFLLVTVNLLLLRLGYVHGLEFPLNSDSVIHAELTHEILASPVIWEMPYYHYGFHYVIAAISKLIDTKIPITILVFGQILQAAAPLGLYTPVRWITGNSGAALLSVWLAGIYWNLPAMSTSWGKYPAMMALASLPFVFTLLYWTVSHRTRRIDHWILLAVITGGAVLIHSRMLILLVIGGICLMPYRFGNNRHRLWFYGALIMALLVLLATEASQMGLWLGAARPYLEPFWKVVMLFVLVLLGAFSLPQPMLPIVGSILLSFLFSGLSKPTFTPWLNTETLLDRPFLSMMLYLPLSLVCGIGFASLDRLIARRFANLGSTAFMVIAFLLALTPNRNMLAPLLSANLVSVDDLRLYPEIAARLPNSARIVIPSDTPYYELGIDGGAWIMSATGVPTVKLAYKSDLTKDETVTMICASGARYMYSGSQSISFLSSRLNQRSDIYQLLIDFPKAKLYTINGCGK